MKDFVDLQGASGAIYRFRLAPDGVVNTPMAGNYALLQEGPQGLVVETVAATNNLADATAALRRSAARKAGLRLYVRLNVSATVREVEKDDIAAHYRGRKRPKGPGETGA